MQVILKGKNKSYVLRLTVQNLIILESVLGKNPLEILNSFNRGTIPKITDVINVLHYSLQPFTDDNKYTLEVYEDFIADGNTFVDIIKIFKRVFEECGLLSKDEETEKNA